MAQKTKEKIEGETPEPKEVPPRQVDELLMDTLTEAYRPSKHKQETDSSNVKNKGNSQSSINMESFDG